MAATVVAAEVQVIGEQYDLAFVLRVPDHHAPQQDRAIGLGLDAGKPDESDRPGCCGSRGLAFLVDLKDGVVFQTRHEEDPGHVQRPNKA